jgi:hypothetical protein
MSRFMGIGVLMALLAGSGVRGADSCPCGSAPESFLQCLAPAGGWCPYGAGFLHWWPRCCFPRCGAADDYCRKPLPNVCWPPYPPYYIWGPPTACPPQSSRCLGH